MKLEKMLEAARVAYEALVPRGPYGHPDYGYAAAVVCGAYERRGTPT